MDGVRNGMEKDLKPLVLGRERCLDHVGIVDEESRKRGCQFVRRGNDFGGHPDCRCLGEVSEEETWLGRTSR